MWSALRQYLVQGWHGSVLEETLEKVPSAQGSQGDDIRARALAGKEQRLQEGQCGLRGSGKQPSPWQCCQVQWQAELSQSSARGTLLVESPFPWKTQGQCCQGFSPADREELVGLTCHKAEAMLTGLVLHAGLAAGVRAVHANLALTHSVVCCVSLCLHDEASIWARGAQARGGTGQVSLGGHQPLQPPQAGVSGHREHTYCLHRYRGGHSASPWSSSADSVHSHSGHRQNFLCHCIRRPAFPLQ